MKQAHLVTPTPTLRQLELFLSLAGSTGIASAGAKVGMTPSATSHALRALEDSLGAALLDRSATGVGLSHAGQQILPHVRDLFAALELIKATAGASAGLKTGQLKLGSFGLSSSLRLLPPILSRFRDKYPGIDVRVFEKPDSEIEQDLIERKLEIGVVTLPRPNFDTLPLMNDQLVAVLPEHHPLASGATVNLRDLAACPFILTSAGSQSLIARMFAKADLTPRITHELSQLLSILDFVSRGEGVSVIAELALPEHYPGVVYRNLSPGSSRRIGFACLNEDRLSPVASAFWRMVKTRRHR
ncbi:LysR family transcriptional regulator [Xylophilus sp. GW821-FHT01B05]